MDHPVGLHRCPHCGNEGDTLTNMDKSGIAPEDGDVCICAYCGQVNKIVGGTVTKMTDADWEVIDSSVKKDILLGCVICLKSSKAPDTVKMNTLNNLMATLKLGIAPNQRQN